LVSSSELLDVDLKKELISKLDCSFYECYGTSEVACVTNISDKENIKSASVGKPLPQVEIKILRDDNTLAIDDEIGEIVCKTPLAFAGYYNRQDLTQNSMWRGYFRTGDLGKIDSEGYLYFQGRKKDIIVTGGINVYPKDIENVLNSHLRVIESCVIPLLDENLGERVVAVVVRENKNLNIRELQRLCARELADFQQPKEFIFIDKLPRNSMGKVLKYTLVDRYSLDSWRKNV
jgi:acyl-CoA synthetase (AMP-forming)/AMP-acid ligase II